MTVLPGPRACDTSFVESTTKNRIKYYPLADRSDGGTLSTEVPRISLDRLPRTPSNN